MIFHFKESYINFGIREILTNEFNLILELNYYDSYINISLCLRKKNLYFEWVK